MRTENPTTRGQDWLVVAESWRRFSDDTRVHFVSRDRVFLGVGHKQNHDSDKEAGVSRLSPLKSRPYRTL